MLKLVNFLTVIRMIARIAVSKHFTHAIFISGKIASVHYVFSIYHMRILT